MGRISPQEGAKEAQEGPRRPKRAQDGPKIGPRCHAIALSIPFSFLPTSIPLFLTPTRSLHISRLFSLSLYSLLVSFCLPLPLFLCPSLLLSISLPLFPFLSFSLFLPLSIVFFSLSLSLSLSLCLLLSHRFHPRRLSRISCLICLCCLSC